MNVPLTNLIHGRISTTIIAPTPLVAANFVILGELIRRMGPQYSRLSPMWCKHWPLSGVSSDGADFHMQTPSCFVLAYVYIS